MEPRGSSPPDDGGRVGGRLRQRGEGSRAVGRALRCLERERSPAKTINVTAEADPSSTPRERERKKKRKKKKKKLTFFS